VTYRCPVRCGDGPFSTENGAVMHAVNKTDDEHAEVTDKRSAYDALNRETAEADGGSKQPSTEDTTDPAENPTFGSADPEADITEPSESDDIKCLECGGELFDFREFAAGEYHAINGQNVYVRGDFQCSDCGRWWVDE
jgi:hypothetical protein